MAFKHTVGATFIVVLAICGAISSAHAEPFKIVGFGDSLMAGFGLGPGQGFTDRLQAALRAKGYDVTVADAGHSAMEPGIRAHLVAATERAKRLA